MSNNFDGRRTVELKTVFKLSHVESVRRCTQSESRKTHFSKKYKHYIRSFHHQTFSACGSFCWRVVEWNEPGFGPTNSHGRYLNWIGDDRRSIFSIERNFERIQHPTWHGRGWSRETKVNLESYQLWCPYSCKDNWELSSFRIDSRTLFLSR